MNQAGREHASGREVEERPAFTAYNAYNITIALITLDSGFSQGSPGYCMFILYNLLVILRSSAQPCLIMDRRQNIEHLSKQLLIDGRLRPFDVAADVVRVGGTDKYRRYALSLEDGERQS